MKLPDVSALALTVVVALATAVGGLLSSIADALLIDASTAKQADVQILQLAINILSEEIPASEVEVAGSIAIRGWAFDTINSVAEIKLGEDSRDALVKGKVLLPVRLSEGSIALAAKGRLFDLPINYDAMKDVDGSETVIAPEVKAIDLEAK
jgi:hypothetical protein